jgi:carbon storage regulator CsrA
MLVLTRKLQQQIKIGEHVTVTILRVKGQTVRVGIEAPRDVRVVRGELPREGEAPAAESTIIETTLMIADEQDEESGDGKVSGLADDRNEEEAVVAAAPSNATMPRTPAPLRLPQRKRFNRTTTPPLRVAHLPSSPSLAK